MIGSAECTVIRGGKAGKRTLKVFAADEAGIDVLVAHAHGAELLKVKVQIGPKSQVVKGRGCMRYRLENDASRKGANPIPVDRVKVRAGAGAVAQGGLSGSRSRRLCRFVLIRLLCLDFDVVRLLLFHGRRSGSRTARNDIGRRNDVGIVVFFLLKASEGRSGEGLRTKT